MTEIYDEIITLIHEHRRDDGQYETIYLPPEEYGEIRDESAYHAQGEQLIGGCEIVVDGWIDEPQILAGSTRELRPDDYYQADPPEQLVRELVTPEETEHTDVVRDKKVHTYRDYAFFEVTRRRQELFHEVIEKYDLDLIGSEPREYDREVDETVRVKFGNTVTIPIDGSEIERELAEDYRDPEHIERWFAKAMREQINSVSQHRVTGTRTRRFRFPYACLDFTHTEEYHAGWRYVHYGRLFMLNIETDAGKIDSDFAMAD